MAFDPLQNPPHRVAIYAAPDTASPWWQRGSTWLGRCALKQQPLPQPANIPGVDAPTLARLTAEPRRYGWHGTLKAPFRLADGVGLAQLGDAVDQLCRQQEAFELSALEVARMGRFLALRPAEPLPPLHALAARCVTQLQSLAAPLTPQDLERRRRAGLTPEQDAHMRAWGYPWVLDQFRFHFSLTGPLDAEPPETTQHLLAAATAHFSGLPPMRLHHLSIFVEPSPGADFVLWQQKRLGP
jgi:putative phosphonate metabolism protein